MMQKTDLILDRATLTRTRTDRWGDVRRWRPIDPDRDAGARLVDVLDRAGIVRRTQALDAARAREAAVLVDELDPSRRPANIEEGHHGA